MEPISALLSTLAGKIAAGAAAAAVTAAGAHGAGVVDLPLPDLDDKPAAVVAEDTPEGADDAKALAEEKSDRSEETEEDLQEIESEEIEDEEIEDEEIEAEDDGDDAGEPNENAEFGQTVAADARGDEDGVEGVDGQAIAAERRAEPPAADRAAEPGAPEDVGARQDAGVRQDDGAGQDADAPEDNDEDEALDTDEEQEAPAAPASQASENRPADTGAGKGR